jgi:hypothetical protein
MLEDVGKISFIKDVIDQARRATKFIYNHAFVLNLVRKLTRNKELLHPTVTRVTNSFISLQSILECHFELKKMFVCDEWHDCGFSTRQGGRAITKLVYTDSFWEGVQEVCTSHS